MTFELLNGARDGEPRQSLSTCMAWTRRLALSVVLSSVLVGGCGFKLAGPAEMPFESLYVALGLRARSELATRLGAEHDSDGALVVDSHQQTTVPGLYAAGDIVQGLAQIGVAIGQAAIAATAIHNGLPLPRA